MIAIVTCMYVLSNSSSLHNNFTFGFARGKTSAATKLIGRPFSCYETIAFVCFESTTATSKKFGWLNEKTSVELDCNKNLTFIPNPRLVLLSNLGKVVKAISTYLLNCASI